MHGSGTRVEGIRAETTRFVEPVHGATGTAECWNTTINYDEIIWKCFRFKNGFTFFDGLNFARHLCENNAEKSTTVFDGNRILNIAPKENDCGR